MALGDIIAGKGAAMYRCWIFGSEIKFFENYNLIKAYENQGMFKIEKAIFLEYYELGALFGNQILSIPFELNGAFPYVVGDIVLILEDGEKLQNIIRAMENSGIPNEYLVPYRVLKVWRLDFAKYMELKKSHPTILSMNCLGGMMYHALCLKFDSPFVNMRFSSCRDFINFLKEPKRYLNYDLIDDGIGYNEEKKVEYPMGRLGDIPIHLRHYKDFESAYVLWNNRKRRMNWDNIIALAYSDDKEDLLEFVKLPISKKVCFTSSVEMDHEAICYLNHQDADLWKIVSLIPSVPYIDMVTLLLEGKIKKL